MPKNMKSKLTVRPVDNSVRTLIVCYISFPAINFPYFLPYSFPVLRVIENISRLKFSAISLGYLRQTVSRTSLLHIALACSFRPGGYLHNPSNLTNISSSFLICISFRPMPHTSFPSYSVGRYICHLSPFLSLVKQRQERSAFHSYPNSGRR